MTPRTDVPLDDWCTLGVGGPARWFAEVSEERGLQQALDWARTQGVPLHILGGGSNVVFADEGFDGLVVRIDMRGVTTHEDGGDIVFSAGAGEPWDSMVAATIAAGCGGLECLSGIPGQVGGTPVQNVGAYGQDVSGSITGVHVVDRHSHAPLMLSNQECRFGYRTSRFKREDLDRFVVTRVEFRLARGALPTVTYADVVSHFEEVGQKSPSLEQVREAVLGIRRRKGMVIEDGNPANRSVGSFFVNPVIADSHFRRLAATERIPHYRVGADAVKVPAAWLIEHVGFAKGYSRGAVGVSPLQAQAIINHGGGTAAEIVALAVDIKRAVREAFEIALVPEPVFVGFPPTHDLDVLLEARGRP